jgi:hypothetical protein
VEAQRREFWVSGCNIADPHHTLSEFHFQCHRLSILSFSPGYKMSFSKLRGSSLLKSVTSRYYPTTYYSLFRPAIYSFMTKTPSNSPQTHLQQIQQQFSTSPSKMSQSNNNFLLSEVFNVKGKVSLHSSEPISYNPIETSRLLS